MHKSFLDLETVAKSELCCSQLRSNPIFLKYACFFNYLNTTPQGSHDVPSSISAVSKRFRITYLWWQRSLKGLYLMSLEKFGKHREIACIIVFKHFDFGFGGSNSSYDCNLVMFNASELLKGNLKRLVIILLPDQRQRQSDGLSELEKVLQLLSRLLLNHITKTCTHITEEPMFCLWNELDWTAVTQSLQTNSQQKQLWVVLYKVSSSMDWS